MPPPIPRCVAGELFRGSRNGDDVDCDGDADARTTVLGAVAEVWEDSWNSSFAYPAATVQTVASNGLTYGRRYAGGSTN